MTRILAALALAATFTVALAGCAIEPGGGQPSARCRDDIKVNHRATRRTAKVKASPAVATVCMGTTVTIEFVPPVGAGVGVTAPKAGNPAWLNGSTGNLQPILINVPSTGISSGDQFDYTITVTGIGFLDPTFIIR